MKLLIISEGYAPQIGGLEKLVQELSEELNKKHDVFVITTTDKLNIYSDIINNIHITYIPLCIKHGKKLFMKELFYAHRTLNKIMKRNEYDGVMLQYLGYLSALFSFTYGYKNIPYSISIHGSDIVANKKLIKIKIKRRVICGAKVLISNSNYLIKKAENELNISLKQNSKIIWNGIHIEKYLSESHLTESNVIISVGRFVHKKGFDILIKALPKIKEKIPDVKLIMIGDGVEFKKCQALSYQLGVNDSIEFVGKVPNEHISDYLRNAKVFVLPSRNEPFGIVVLEAMAIGLPVIVTDSGGVVEIVQNEINGYIVPNENSEAIAIKVIELLKNNKKINIIHKANLERVKKFSFEHFINQYNEVIRRYL